MESSPTADNVGGGIIGEESLTGIQVNAGFTLTAGNIDHYTNADLVSVGISTFSTWPFTMRKAHKQLYEEPENPRM